MLGWRHSCGKGLVQSPCPADLDRGEDKAELKTKLLTAKSCKVPAQKPLGQGQSPLGRETKAQAQL